MEFQLYTCKIGKDLERSYTVYARSLGPLESHTIEPAFIRVIPLKRLMFLLCIQEK